MPVSKNGFHYSEGNSKMNKVYSFSVMPLVTCAKKLPCASKCYANKIVKLRPNVRKCYTDNTHLLMEEKEYGLLVEDTVEYIKKNSAKLFRWNVAGDLFSVDYLKAMVTIADLCPDTTFWAFTKQFKVLKDALKEVKVPKNMTIILSAWGNFMPPKDLMKQFGVCYVQDKDGLFTVPPNAYVCGGDCEHCQVCAHLTADKCVVIHEH